MYRVGLTGGIGSGKSTVANIFSELGICVIDTDLIAHQIMSSDGPAYQPVIEQFGSEILNKDHSINRKKLASIVFNSAQEKQKLESILHPLIWLIVEQQVQQCHTPYCIVVVPLLFEGQNESRFDSVLVIDSPEEMQIQRVLERDKRSIDEIHRIMDNQLSRDERLKKADKIITNDSDPDKLTLDIKALHKEYLLLAQAF